MNANGVQLWSTTAVVVLCVISAAIVLPYAVRELLADRRRLRGQFALGLGVLFAGVAARLTAALLFYFTPVAERAAMLATLHPWILWGNLMIALGALQCIRLVTLTRSGEIVW